MVLHPLLKLDVQGRDCHGHLLSYILITSDFFCERFGLAYQRWILSPQLLNFILKLFIYLFLLLLKLPILCLDFLELILKLVNCVLVLLDPVIFYLRTCVSHLDKYLNVLICDLYHFFLKTFFLRFLRFSELLVLILVNESLKVWKVYGLPGVGGPRNFLASRGDFILLNNFVLWDHHWPVDRRIYLLWFVTTEVKHVVLSWHLALRILHPQGLHTIVLYAEIKGPKIRCFPTFLLFFNRWDLPRLLAWH